MYLSIIQGVKYLLLIGIFGLSTAIGFLISKSYQNRVVELKEFKTILNIMKTKIKFTYEPLAEIFKQISKDNDTEIEKIFGQMANQLSYYQVKEVWENCIQDADISIKQEDKDILKKLGKLLGQTDVDGQISEIEVTENFLDMQIENAEEEKKKNQKIYKTLGVVAGYYIGLTNVNWSLTNERMEIKDGYKFIVQNCSNRYISCCFTSGIS